MEKFFSLLYQQDDPEIAIRAIEEPRPEGRPAYTSPPMKSKLSKTKNLITTYNDAHKWGTFFMVGQAEKAGMEDADIKKHHALYIDIDNGPLPEYFPVEPSAIFSRDDTHHHVYWFLKNPLEDNETFKALQMILIKFYDSDRAIHNPARLMRIPGTINHKTRNKKAYEVKQLQGKYYTYEGINLAHTDPKKKEKAARDRIKRLFPDKKLKDGDGRHAIMIKACFVLHDYDYSGSLLLQQLQWINEKFLVDKYTDTELKNIASSNKYAKNERGKSAGEHSLREGARMARMCEALMDWYYVVDMDAFVHLSNPSRLVTKAAFNIQVAHIAETSNAVGWASTKGLLNLVDGITYEPAQQKLIHKDNQKFINLHEPGSLVPAKKEPTWFTDHVLYLFNNNAKDAEHFFNYLAHMVQKPDIRINHALLIIGKHKGTGKSSLFEIFRYVFGEKNCVSPENEHIADKYTGWAKNCRLCFIHELAQFNKMAFTRKVKSFITEPRIQIREMFHPPFEINNYMQIIATSNHNNPIKLEKFDRRWWVIESFVKKKDKEYYKKLYEHIENDTGQVLHWLQNKDISDFSPYAEPPLTSTKEMILEQSKSDLEIYLQRQIEEGNTPFDNRFVNISDIYDHRLPDKYRHDRCVTYNRIVSTLIEMGAVRIEHQIKIDGKPLRFLAIFETEEIQELQDAGDRLKINELVREQYTLVKDTEKELAEVF